MYWLEFGISSACINGDLFVSFSVALDIYKQSSYNIYIYFHKLSKQSLPLQVVYKPWLFFQQCSQVFVKDFHFFVRVFGLDHLHPFMLCEFWAESVNLWLWEWSDHDFLLFPFNFEPVPLRRKLSCSIIITNNQHDKLEKYFDSLNLL